jgi:MFS transporter, AAHS family, 3-hydroxyphenylpropionic acid transporter
LAIVPADQRGVTRGGRRERGITMASADQATSPHALRTLLLCAAAALVEGFDTQSMGVAAPRVISEFGLSPAWAGFVFSSATFGLFLGAAIGGRLADYFGRKRALIASLLLFGIFSLLTAMASGAESLSAARLFTGLGLGGAMPNFISLSSEATRSRRRVSAVTIVMAGMPFGGALSAILSLSAQLGWSWRWIFVVGGATPLILAVIMMYFLPEHRRSASAAPAGDAAPGGNAAWVPVESVRTVLFGPGRAATTVMLWVAFFFTQLVLLLMLNWLPSLVIGLGFSRTEASAASVCFGLSGSFGAVLLGHLHAGTSRRWWVVATYGGMAAALVAVASVGSAFWMVATACAIAGVFIIGAQLILFALAPLYYRAAIRGTGVGAAVAVGRLGSVVGPLFAGGLLASGGGSAAVLMAIVPFVVLGGSAAFALTWGEQCGD